MEQLSFEWSQEPLVALETPTRRRVVELMASAILAVADATGKEDTDEQA